MSVSSEQIYFEKQGRFSNNCAVHTVNNLIGFPAFSSKTFDEISSILQTQAKANGYTTKTKHIMGGDYDVNVIQKALQNLGLETTWIDSRVEYSYKYEEGTFPKGYILNFPSEENMLQKMLSYSNRHWICVKMQNTDYFLLDSKKEKEFLIEDIIYFINRMRASDDCKILEVRARIQGYKPKQPQEDVAPNRSVIMESSSDEAEMKSKESCNEDEFKDCLNLEKNFEESVDPSPEIISESTQTIGKSPKNQSSHESKERQEINHESESAEKSNQESEQTNPKPKQTQKLNTQSKSAQESPQSPKQVQINENQ